MIQRWKLAIRYPTGHWRYEIDRVGRFYGLDVMMNNVESYADWIDKFRKEGKLYQPSWEGFLKFIERSENEKQIQKVEQEQKQSKKDNEAGSTRLKAYALIKQCLGKEEPETLTERRFCNDILESYGMLSKATIEKLLKENALSKVESNHPKGLWRQCLEDEPGFYPYHYSNQDLNSPRHDGLPF